MGTEHINKKVEDNEAIQEYIFTEDNFMKMVLIYLRAMHRIPNVIMGQTGINIYIYFFNFDNNIIYMLFYLNLNEGCGKTALVRYLAINVLKMPS